MALQAEKGDLHIEQVVVHRAVRPVAIPAVVSNICVLKEKGPILICVTLYAGLFDGGFFYHPVGVRAMGIMAVCAKNPLFRHRVVTRQRELRLCLHVALVAHIKGISRPHLEIMTRMDIVAVRAGNVVQRMAPCIPVMEVEGRIRSMTFQADEGFCL